jgi:hypothetical protein
MDAPTKKAKKVQCFENRIEAVQTVEPSTALTTMILGLDFLVYTLTDIFVFLQQSPMQLGNFAKKWCCYVKSGCSLC